MKLIDISQGWKVGMPKFGADWYPPFAVHSAMDPSTDPAGVNRTFSALSLFAHNASHVESSLHFDPDGAPIDSVDLQTFFGPAVVADLSEVSDLHPIEAADLERTAGPHWRPGYRLIVRTDYPRRALGSDAYWDAAPYLTPSAADWIVDHQAALVGMDCLTEKPGDAEFAVHRRILLSGIPLLENLANLHEVDEAVVWLVAPPVKIAGVEAAPSRPMIIEGLDPSTNVEIQTSAT